MNELLNNKTFAVHAAAAAASVALGTAVTYPLDTLKALMQVGSTGKRPLTAADVLYRVRVLSGYSGLYNGVGWLIMGRTLGLGVRFGVYEILTAFYEDGREDDHLLLSEAMLAGFASGTVESLVSSPFEMIKVRAQVASASRITTPPSIVEKSVVPPLVSRLLPRCSLDMTAMSKSISLLSTLTTRNGNILDSLKEYPWMMTGSGKPPPVSNVRTLLEIVSLEGWTALWRGYRSGIVRDSIFGGLFFGSWQFLHEVMLNWKAVNMDPIPRYDSEVGPLSPVAVSLSAGVSGAFAAAVSHGFDTTRNRSQCTVLPKYLLLERKFLMWPKRGNRFERLTGIHPADRNLLLNGIGLRMARCGLASSIIVGSYFFAINHLVPS
ncbi:mitochondrial arginine transporter BAC2 [Salvia miltiorrhiza]|uniref:mitochondrial arginine transporter BAC2 n=1 Tax=Salvia miltiorrhiza TaxID=226208 RepID=UPI0025AB63EB|nr:mitochondrial arginine transporter BAC2 [Salvia miltiorrhiza]